MSRPFYVRFEISKEVADATYETIQIAARTGSVRKGTNETTKAIERGQARLVIIAEDVEPPEVVAHLPILCEERKTPYVFVPSKAKLGSAVGIDVPSAAVCIVEPGDASELMKEITARVENLKKAGRA